MGMDDDEVRYHDDYQQVQPGREEFHVDSEGNQFTRDSEGDHYHVSTRIDTVKGDKFMDHVVNGTLAYVNAVDAATSYVSDAVSGAVDAVGDAADSVVARAIHDDHTPVNMPGD
jgi:hypothetical protein